MSFPLCRWLLCATFLSGQAHAEELPSNVPASMVALYASSGEAEFTGKLTLDAAILKVLGSAPRLKSAEAGVRASEGERAQAGLWQNPEIGVEAENFAGGGNYGGFDSSEVTLGVSQVLEISGKRSSRVAMAEQELAQARFGQTAETLEVIRDTAVTYTNAVAAQEALKLAAEQKELASGLFKEVRELVDAAREPLIQKSKAEITVSTANFAHERAERELEHTKQVLASLWGGHGSGYALEEKDFFALTAPMTEPEAEALLREHPLLGRYHASHERARARFELEKAQAIPDPRVNVGVRDFRASGDQAMVAGISIPIPVFNRNQGGIERARAETSKAVSDAQAVRLTMVNQLHEALEMQVNAYRQAENLKSSILPAAEKAFKLSREGYRSGRFPYLEVLDAQRTLFEVKEQYITTLKEYHTAKAEVERLTARPVQATATGVKTHAE